MPRLGYTLALVFVVGMGAGSVLNRYVMWAFLPPKAWEEFQLIAQAWRVIHQFYVDRSALQPSVLTYGAISGMVAALGDTGHSAFLPPTLAKRVQELEEGQYKGIGAEVQMQNGQVVIVTPIDGSPAQAAELRPGDIILKVDGKGVAGLPLNEVVDRIAGPEGTSVALTILDPRSGQTREVTIERAAIKLQSLTWQRLPGTSIAHLRIARFSQGVTEDLRQALTEIRRADLTGLILDLRSDPGGLLDEAVGTASQFLKDGNVLLVRDAKGQTTPVAVQTGGLAPDLPLVVLVNRGTASAAEIVAGALQDAKRATLVGEPTFGTGTVLNGFPMPGGAVLLLAVKEWLTPSGLAIWHRGIAPDEVVPLEAEAAPLSPSAVKNLTMDEIRGRADAQLLRAVELLAGPPKPQEQ